MVGTCGRELKGKDEDCMEEENRKLARTVQELQHRLDETREGTKPVLTDFTALANELHRMLRLEVFSTVIKLKKNQLVIMKCVLRRGQIIYLGRRLALS